MRTSASLCTLLVLSTAAFAACSSDDARRDGGPSTGNGGSGGAPVLGTTGGAPTLPDGPDLPGGVLVPECEANCEDFPAEPIVEDVTAAQQAALDGSPSGAGPCVTEPANGTMFPAGWTRPRFNFSGGSVHKITLSAAKEKNQLVVYTNKIPYYLPKEIWEGLSKNVHDEDITYTIRTGDGAGAPTETTGTFRIAPVAAGGSMVFWGSKGSEPGPYTNTLYGFGVGEEGVIAALSPGDYKGVAIQDNAQLREEYADTKGQSVCVGCHTSSPDGKAVATLDHWEWNIRVGSIEAETRGAAPEFLSAAGAAMISMTWLGAPTFSIGDWNTGARRMVTTWSESNLQTEFWNTHSGKPPTEITPLPASQLVWMNLASTAAVPVDLRTATADTFSLPGQDLQKAIAAMQGTDWGVIPRNGDPNHAVMPDWSHDGKTIAYISTDAPQDGRVGTAKIVDIYTAPYDGVGDAKAVPGASSEDFFEYYPDFAPDDSLIAFNRVPKFDTGTDKKDAYNHVYYRPDSDIYVVPTAGGEAVRLASNDPSCPSEGTAGMLYNSWAKWSPSFAMDDGSGRTFYFLIFSTSRNSPFALNRGNARTSPASQLYMATIVKNADGSIESYPAIYLWNQNNLVDAEGNLTALGTNNVTPAWDEFKIPPVPPVIIK